MEDDERLYLIFLFLLLFLRVVKSVYDCLTFLPPTGNALKALKMEDEDKDAFVARARSILNDVTTKESTGASVTIKSASLDALALANFALHSKSSSEKVPKKKRLLVSLVFLAFGLVLVASWWFWASPERDRQFAASKVMMMTETKKLDALAKRILNDEERGGEMEVVVRAHFVRKRGPMETKMARDIREKFKEWVLGSFDGDALERGRKTEEVARVTFRGCADVLDGEAFEASTSNEKSAEEEVRKSFVACDKGRSELARRARFYARSTRASGDERDENENGDGESAKSGMYAHVENEMRMKYATYPNEIYAYFFDDENEVEDDSIKANFHLHFGTDRNAFVDAKWTSSEWGSRGGFDAMTKIRESVQKLYSSAWKVTREDAKFDGHFGASAASLSFVLVLPDDDEENETLSWDFRKDVREPFVSNLSKRLEHFLNIEAESRVVYHSRAEEDKVGDSHASTTNQEAAERFTRALPLRKMDVDLIPSMPSGKFVVFRKNDNNDDAFLPKNWFVKRDNVGITILERRESVTGILPFLFANVRARLLGVDITSDETYAKYALPDAANILSMIEMDALSSTRVRADMLEIVEILRGATNLGDIDAKDASYLASRSKESLAMLRDAVAMMDENRRQEAFKLVAKARKLAFQTSRESINVREDVTFPFEHELALAMPLVLPLLVAFTVRFAREFARYLARRRCFEELASNFHRGKVD